MWNLIYLITGFVFIILLIAVFFSKEVISSKENKVFRRILIANILCYMTEIPLQILVRTIGIDSLIIDVFCRLYLISISITYSIFSMYVFTICLNKENQNYEKNLDKYKKIIFLFQLIVLAFLVFLPFEKYYDASKMFIQGPALDLLKIYIVIQIILYIVLLLKNYKKLKNKKYLPIYFVIVCLIFMTILNSIDPSVLITTMIGTFICYMMVFTIENPDLKLLREIQKSKEYAEHANNEKAMFLYNMTQEIRTPIKRIEEKCEDIINENDIEILKEEIRGIKFAAKKLTGTINGILDVSAIEKNTNIEIINNKYSPDTLLKQIISISKNNLADKNKDIEFRTNIDNNIPEYLYGDSIRIKQIIMTIINNAIKHTEKGFIEFDVNAVIKYDICRLIITIEDSGIGIEADRLENLFYNEYDISDEKINKVDDTKESLSIIKVLTSLIGGTVVVNSEISKGSKFTVVLDQKIYVDEKDTAMNAVEKLSINKKVLVVDDDEVSLKNTLKVLNKFDISIETVMWGQECLKKIRRKEKYDLILLDEDMPKLNGIKTFEKIKEENFSIPVVLMVESKHMEYKSRYIESGFAGCIEKPIKKNDIKDILKEIEK